MAILPEERRENVVASLFTYLKTNYTLTKSDCGGEGIDEENTNFWVRADVMFTTPRNSRQVDQQGNMGSEPFVMMNMNVFAKESAADEETYKPIRMVDTLCNLFRVPLGIPVMNHVDGMPLVQIGVLQTFELDDTNLGLNESLRLYQRNVTSTMRYVFKWEAPS